MRVLISVAASLMLMLALVGPVAATGPGCSDWGASSATGGHREIPGLEGVPFGLFVSQIKNGVMLPWYASVRELVQGEHLLNCSE